MTPFVSVAEGWEASLMGDRYQARASGEGSRPPSGTLVRVMYCVVGGALVTLVGGVASLLVEGVGMRLLVWLATSGVAAVAVGWGFMPLSPYRHRAEVRAPHRNSR
jgi:hypothetical protein